MTFETSAAEVIGSADLVTVDIEIVLLKLGGTCAMRRG
jgi:hypothetical protein